MSVPTIQAGTQTVGASASTTLGPGTSDGNSWRVLVRTPNTGVFVGDGSVTSTNGYELLPNVEYEFIVVPGAGYSASSDYSLNVKNNNGGSSITISWLATRVL